MNFAQRLRKLRKARGLRQWELANDLSIAQSTVGMWESEDRQPNFNTLCALADYFGVSTDYLLGRDLPSSDATSECPYIGTTESLIVQQRLKDTFARNLRRYMGLAEKKQSDIVSDLSLTASTVSDWINAKKHPRPDKVLALANYLGIPMTALLADAPASTKVKVKLHKSHLVRGRGFKR